MFVTFALHWNTSVIILIGVVFVHVGHVMFGSLFARILLRFSGAEDALGPRVEANWGQPTHKRLSASNLPHKYEHIHYTQHFINSTLENRHAQMSQRHTMPLFFHLLFILSKLFHSQLLTFHLKLVGEKNKHHPISLQNWFYSIMSHIYLYEHSYSWT